MDTTHPVDEMTSHDILPIGSISTDVSFQGENVQHPSGDHPGGYDQEPPNDFSGYLSDASMEEIEDNPVEQGENVQHLFGDPRGVPDEVRNCECNGNIRDICLERPGHPPTTPPIIYMINQNTYNNCSYNLYNNGDNNDDLIQ